MAAVLEPYIYEGGIHKHTLLLELLEDLGGYLIQKTPAGTEVTLTMLVPREDIHLIEKLAADLLGKVSKAPLTGVDIAVVSPTLASHHLPHSACDVAEYLRRDGANTTMVGLARGMGARVALSDNYERRLINEHDVAIFTLGNFSNCIMHKKSKLFEGVRVPVIVTGGPMLQTEDVPGADLYIGNIGRVAHRLRKEDELNEMDIMNKKVGETIVKIRESLAKDPLAVLPPRIMKEIEEQVPEIETAYTPAPLTLQLDGIRIKLPYDQYHQRIEDLELQDNIYLKDVATITPSKMKDYILVKIKRKSEVGIEI